MKAPQINKDKAYHSIGNVGDFFFGFAAIRGSLCKYLTLILLSFGGIMFISPESAYSAAKFEDTPKHIVLSLPESDARMGEASSSIPIIVPPGRNGIEPKLALNYNSSNKRNGIAGVGWDLNIGYIQRNTRLGLDYTNNIGDNPFIVSMEGASGELVSLGSGYYGLEIEGAFYKFYFNTGSNYWEVTSKDGTKYYFGQTLQSRQYDPNNSSRVFKWCLDRVEDTNNNYMEIEYSNLSNATLGGELLDDNEIYLKAIRYTYHDTPYVAASYSVIFYLEDQDNPIPYYNPGFEVVTSKRMKTIAVLYGTNVVRAYALNYQSGGSTDSLKSLLESVQQYGSNAWGNQTTGEITSGSALPEIVFDYYTYPANSLKFSEAVTWFTVAPQILSSVSSADFNGDGRMDLMATYVSPVPNSPEPTFDTYTAIYMSNEDGSFGGSTPTSVFGVPIGNANTVFGPYSRDSFIPVDIDGDGKDDFIRNGYKGTKSVLLSNGDGTFTTGFNIPRLFNYNGGNDWGSFHPLDFNGDGNMDLIVAEEEYKYVPPGSGNLELDTLRWYLYESDGDNSFTFRGSILNSLDYPFQIIDFNNDGKTDLAVQMPGGYHAFISDGNGAFVDQGVVVININSGEIVKSWGDYNGDGLTDALVSHNTQGQSRIYFSKGDYTFDVVPVNISLINEGAGCYYQQGDFNGDGLTDILTLTTDGAYPIPPSSNILHLYLSNGDGTFRDSSSLEIWHWPYPDPPSWDEWVCCYANNYISRVIETAGDFNGDGKTELFGTDPDLNWKFTSFSDNGDVTGLVPLPDQLKTVENGKGGTTTFNYLPSSVYEKDDEDIMPFITQTVSSIAINDGNGHTYTTSYDYYGADFDKAKKEFLGFKNIYKTNPDGGYEVTEYLQEHYTKNRPLKTLFYDSEGGTLRIQTDYTWGTYSTNLDVWAFVYLDLKKTTYDNNASYYTQDDYTYDNTNGFPEYVYKTGTDANGQPVAQVTQYTGYSLYGTDAWRVSKEVVAETYNKDTDAATNLARKMTYGYDGNGNMTSKTFWRTETDDYTAISYTHNGFGNVLTETDGLNHTTTIDYETATYTYPWHITNAKNQVITKTWDYRFGKENTVTDPNNNTTDYNYDPFGRNANTAFPDGGYTYTVYTYYDRTTFPRYIITKTLESGTIASGNYIEKIEYFDGLDRSLRIATWGIDDDEQPIQIFTDTTYDTMGRKEIVYGPYKDNAPANQIYFEKTYYDKLGRVDSIESPSSVPEDPAIIDYAYPNFFTTVITDPDSKQKTEKRDYLGRIIEVIEHANSGLQTTYYGYNSAGDMTYVENALGYPTIIAYDARGLKTGMDDPDMGVWSYTYDENGNLSTQIDSKSQVITFNYEELNRVYQKIYTPSSSNNPTVTYTYDLGTNGIGQLYSVTNTKVTTIYDEYDPMGRVKSVAKTITGDQERTTETDYDLSGKVEYVTHPDGFWVHNVYYPGTGLLNTVTGKPSVGSEVEYAKCTEYEATGKIGRITHAYNDTETVYTYDPKTTRLSSLLTSGPAPGNITIQNKTYTYSKAGDIETVIDNLKGITYTYDYDNLHRLLEESTTDNSAPTSAEELIYTYGDSEHINAVTSINYNGTNYAFTYDANGNMLTGYDFTNPGSVVSRSLTWNADNMPVLVTRNGVTTNLTYDGDGVRAKKVAGGTTTYYISNDYEIKNGVHTKYVFAGNLRVASVDDSDINTSKIYHKDHLGSSVAITDNNAGDIETSEYLPFGGMREHTGTTASDYKFTDQELDNESNLYNYDARLYDPVIGRFVNSDSLIPDWFYPQNLNRYSYCLNNPIVYIDPNGHAPYRNMAILAPGDASTELSVAYLQQYNNVVRKDIGSIKEIARAVSEGNMKLEVLILKAHGLLGEGGVILDSSKGENGQFSYKGLSQEDNKDAVDKIKSQLTPNSIIVFAGCRVGSYRDDMKKIANLFQTKVWAFTGDLTYGLEPCTDEGCKKGKWVSESPDKKRRGSGKNSDDYNSDKKIDERTKRFEEMLDEIMKKIIKH